MEVFAYKLIPRATVAILCGVRGSFTSAKYLRSPYSAADPSNRYETNPLLQIAAVAYAMYRLTNGAHGMDVAIVSVRPEIGPIAHLGDSY
jgi:hypothetical protein